MIGCSGRFAGDRFSVGRTRGSAAFRRFRRQPDEFLHEQPRQPFDPFMLYCAIPQFVRGWELESHFKIPRTAG